MSTSEILVAVIVVIACLLTLLFMVKKGIRPNSPFAKIMGRRSVCKAKKCNVLLKKNEFSDYCEFHIPIESCLRRYKEDIKNENKSELNIRRIKDGMDIDGSSVTNKIRGKYTKDKLYKGAK